MLIFFKSIILTLATRPKNPRFKKQLFCFSNFWQKSLELSFKFRFKVWSLTWKVTMNRLKTMTDEKQTWKKKKKKLTKEIVSFAGWICQCLELIFLQQEQRYFFSLNSITVELLIYNESLLIDYVMPNLSSFSFRAIFLQSQFQVLKTSN